MTLNKKRILFLSGLVLMAAFTRLMPHPFNFTAVGAIALFGGASFKQRHFAILIPMLSMFITDMIIGFHANMWAVYLSFGLIALLGMGMRNNRTIKQIFGRSIAGSAVFFLLTNFAVWLGNPLYAQNLEGLMTCYAVAIPFLENSMFGSLALNTVMGDFFFNGVLFGSLAFAELKFPALQPARA